MKTAYLIIICFCWSCNLDNSAPEYIERIEDMPPKVDQEELDLSDLGAPSAGNFLPLPGSIGFPRSAKGFNRIFDDRDY